jgi:hypothetical protein
LAQQVVVGVVHQAQPLAGQVPVVVAQQVVVVEAAHRQAHAVLAVLAVTAFFWSTKSLEYEQSLRHPWWHRPQHHCP